METFKLETQSAGAARVVEERNDHFKTHGFDEDHDKQNNAEELKYAAIFLLNPEKYAGVYPSWWDKKWKEKFLALSNKERIVRACALLTAEYDRLEAEERINAGTGQQGTGIKDGGLVQEMRDNLKEKKEDLPTSPGPDANLTKEKEAEQSAQ